MSQSLAQVPALQIFPAPQAVPIATLLHAVVLTPGWQLWHEFSGFAAFEA